MARKMLYQPAPDPNPELDNARAIYGIFEGDGIDAALQNGWYKSPADFPAEGAPDGLATLAQPAAKIIAALPELTVGELKVLLDAEQADKNRAGLVAAIQKELKGREA